MRQKFGFTMVELIFVIVILGILAAVAVPKMNASRDDASAAAAKANLRTLINDLQNYYTAKSGGFGTTTKGMDELETEMTASASQRITYTCGSKSGEFSGKSTAECTGQIYDITKFTSVPLIAASGTSSEIGSISTSTDKKAATEEGSYAKLKEAYDKVKDGDDETAKTNAKSALDKYVGDKNNWTEGKNTTKINVTGSSYILQAKKGEDCLKFAITSSSTLEVTALKAASASGTGCAKFLASNAVKSLLKDPKTGTQIGAGEGATLTMDFSGRGVKF